jgi:phage repressor protein C with HTH and peptisase S24 domain
MSCSCKNTPGGTCASETPAVEDDSGCSGGEPVALQVLGDNMAPEFRHGDIIVVEPDGALTSGCFVLICIAEDWQLRQLARDEAGWLVRYLNPAPGQEVAHRLEDLGAVWGVVIQKSVPGRRRESKSYAPAQARPAPFPMPSEPAHWAA